MWYSGDLTPQRVIQAWLGTRPIAACSWRRLGVDAVRPAGGASTVATT
jgi:hypothetical protein